MSYLNHELILIVRFNCSRFCAAHGENGLTNSLVQTRLKIITGLLANRDCEHEIKKELPRDQ